MKMKSEYKYYFKYNNDNTIVFSGNYRFMTTFDKNNGV